MGEIFERPSPPHDLKWTGERLTSETSGQTEIEHLHRYFFARALCRGLDVLDIASGEGYGSAMIAQVAASVTGVEIDPAAVQHANEAYSQPGLRYLQGDARKIPLPDRSVDAVVSFETLEHFFEHDIFMTEVRRVLRPDGFLLISSPERDIYSPAGGAPNPYHVHELTRTEFDNLLRQHFSHVALYGQRPFLGAALIPEFSTDIEASPFLTFERRDRKLFEASVGLPRPIYLVAIASDVPIAKSRGSLFVETSGVEAIFARDIQARDEQKRLSDRLMEEGEYAQRVQAELNRRDEQLASKVAEADDWHRQLVRRNEEFAIIEGSVGQLRSELAQALQREGDVNKQLASKVAEADDWYRQLVRRNEEFAIIEGSVGQLRSDLAQALQGEADINIMLRQEQSAYTSERSEVESLRLEIGHLSLRLVGALREKAQAESTLDAIYRSSSWRLTSPIRGLATRHPLTAQRLQSLLARYPRSSRLAKRVVRSTWRLMTLRSPRFPVAIALPGVAPSIALPDVAIQAQEAAHTMVRYTPRLVNLSDKPNPDTLPRGNTRRLLFVSHVLPYPPRAGNEYRIHRLLSWLAEEGWNIFVVLCPLPGDHLSETQIAQMAGVYPNLIICQHDGTIWHNIADETNLLEPLRGVIPREYSSLLGEDDAPSQQARVIQLQRTFCPDILVELLIRLDAWLQPDVFLAEYIFMTRPFALLRPDLIKVVDTIDVFSTKAKKVERYGVSDGLALTEDEEALLLHSADIVIGIQPDEAADLARLSPGNQVLSVGVDFPVNQVPRSVPGSPTALLVASANPMNVKGVKSFLQYAWPLVLQTVPNAVLRVVGPIGDVIQDVPRGVEIVGRVDELGPEYADARVAINPAIAGTGLKIKTVEALCHLRPVVTWPAGVEGIGPEARPFCHVATHWFGFAQALIKLLTDDEEAGAIGKAQEALARALSPAEVYAPLRNALEQGRR